ncbi:hypothetical protein C471_03238 [Halorubrum saccharovorum DSM 1137]|uniref:Uncharacterized protein n=1 Tax=Halorubrum saccharovorum DSM 1137 TaxID=1227484 RepID=M0E7U2_9EURY|nr:DUF5806 family protein [Halorubrum saccharovorum]ELZ42439.1 hypothetical protein C471_03238 [Halorubrum saccharovorum DSM 1137]
MNDPTDPASDGGSDPSNGTAGSAADASESTDPSRQRDADAIADEGAGGDASGNAVSGADAPSDGEDAEAAPSDGEDAASSDRSQEQVPPEVRKYERFKKMDGARYERVNEFLRDRTYITAREWAIARLCADFRTETGVEMTKIGENLPELVPFMTDTYTPQAVNQARYSFEEKVTKAGATFLYGAMSGFFTAEDLDEMMYEVTEVAKFLLEVEGVDLAVADELEAEDRISEVMREVRASSADLRGEEVRCPECGHVHEPAEE